MTSDAPTTSVPTADTEAGTGLTRAEVIHLRGQLEPVPVNCRVRRRLGQHTIKRDGTAIGLDAYLALERAAGTDNRIPLTTDADPADLLQSLADKSSSPVVVRLFTDESPDHEATWLLDQDQLAGLLGHGWTTTPQEPRPLCCGPLAATHYQLTAPDLLPGTDADQSDRAGRPLRDRLKDHATYGKVTNAPSCTTNQSFTAKPSHGSGSGTPGIELTEHQLTHLRAQANAPSLKFGDWIIVRRDFRSAVGPEQLRLPATLRERTATEAHTCHRQHDCTPADIGVDQVIRLALGVGVWERLTARGCHRREGPGRQTRPVPSAEPQLVRRTA